MTSPLWEDTWMSTCLPLHSNLGGMSGFPLLLLMWWISALWECTVPASWLIQWQALVSLWLVMAMCRCTVKMRLYATACTVLVKLLSSMRRMVSAELGDIGGWCAMLSVVMRTRSRGGDVTSWTDGVGECGTYWTDELVDEMEMWWVCWALNFWRSLVVNWASSPMRVLGSWSVEVGELMDGLEFPNIVQQWKTQRGSRQKVVWV